MRFLLIYPPPESFFIRTTRIFYGLSPPLGLLYVAKVLQNNGNTVTILDFSAEQFDEQKLRTTIQQTDAVGLVYYAGDAVVSDTLREKLTPGATIHEVAKRTTKKIFENDKLSRIFAIAETPKPKGLELLKSIKKDIVVLEDLSISGNIGNIIRTSLALDMGGMILLNMDPLDLYDRRLIRASRGYMFTLPIMTASTKDFLHYCKTNNETLLFTAMEAEKSVEEIAHP